jgi:hypothetical protein
MSYNTKNYHEQNGDKWVIGGALEVLPGAAVTGIVPKAENQIDSEAPDLPTIVGDFNALLAKLKAAGLMQADPE